jgi:hypothetical protein
LGRGCRCRARVVVVVVMHVVIMGDGGGVPLMDDAAVEAATVKLVQG